MAFPVAIIPAIISAVAGIVNTISNRRAEKKRAAKQFAYDQAANEQVYEQNKELAQQNFDMLNKYNTPSAQMARFSDAGLNPNLIYGQGNSGNASPPSTPNLQSAQYKENLVPLNLQIPDMIAMYQNYEVKQAGLDRTKTQTELLNQKVRTEAVDRMNKLLHGETGKFNLDLAKELRKYNVDIRSNEATQSGLKAKMLAKEFALLDEFGSAERKSRLKTQTLQQARTAIGTKTDTERLELLKQFGWTEGYQKSAAMESNIMNAQQQAMFNKLKTTLFREHQISPSDNFLVRMLMHFLMDKGLSAEDFLGTDKSPMPPK